MQANAVDPGWVPTKMGGAGAPDDLELGHRTQERLISDPAAASSGGYWFHDRQQDPHPAVLDAGFQDELLRALEDATGGGVAGQASARPVSHRTASDADRPPTQFTTLEEHHQVRLAADS